VGAFGYATSPICLEGEHKRGRQQDASFNKDLKLPDGRDRVVRHGHGPHRAIQTGVGPVEVRRAG
jgi:hypothetical protein